MKKAQLEAIIKANAKRRTGTIQGIIDSLTNIVEERDLTKGMYFWHPSDCAGFRRQNEKRRNIALDCEMKGLHVHYERDYSESCRYVYASDKLWADECDSFTCRDIAKLVEGFTAIVDKRNKAA